MDSIFRATISQGDLRAGQLYEGVDEDDENVQALIAAGFLEKLESTKDVDPATVVQAHPDDEPASAVVTGVPDVPAVKPPRGSVKKT